MLALSSLMVWRSSLLSIPHQVACAFSGVSLSLPLPLSWIFVYFAAFFVERGARQLDLAGIK
jgi:hypothetical protein